MYQGRQVDHLHDGRHGGVLIGGVAAGLPHQEHEPCAQLLALEALDVVGHVADRLRRRQQLGVQDLTHALQAGGHGLEDLRQLGACTAHDLAPPR